MLGLFVAAMAGKAEKLPEVLSRDMEAAEPSESAAGALCADATKSSSLLRRS